MLLGAKGKTSTSRAIESREWLRQREMASFPYEYIFKYIIIGDMGVGKSCLLHQFTEKKCKVPRTKGGC
jgi:GTP-binding protein EngB required for normal cell division